MNLKKVVVVVILVVTRVEVVATSDVKDVARDTL